MKNESAQKELQHENNIDKSFHFWYVIENAFNFETQKEASS